MIVNQTQLADVLGITTQTLNKYQKLGMPVCVLGRRGQASEYDTAACHRWVVDYQLAQRSGSTGEVLNLDAERARLTKQQADHQTLVTAKLRGELIPLDAVIFSVTACNSAIRSKFLGLASKMANRFPEAQPIVDDIDREIRDILEELSNPASVSRVAGDTEEFDEGADEDVPAAPEVVPTKPENKMPTKPVWSNDRGELDVEIEAAKTVLLAALEAVIAENEIPQNIAVVALSALVGSSAGALCKTEAECKDFMESVSNILGREMRFAFELLAAARSNAH